MEDQPAQGSQPWSTIRANLSEGKLTDAREALQRCMHEHPQDVQTWLCEAAYRLQTEEWDAAEMAIAQASMLGPGRSDVALLDATYCRLTDNTEGALLRAQEAIECAKDQPERQAARLAFAAHTIAHIAATKALVFEEASPDEDEWEGAEDAENAETTHACADDAIAALQDLLQEAPDCLEAIRELAGMFEIREAYDDALDTWERADKLSPGNPNVLYGMGRNLERLNYQTDAYETYVALYDAEQAAAASTEDLLFTPASFQAAANEAWTRLFEDWSLDSQPVEFDFRSAIYPAPEMLEESSPDDIFDPRVGLHVAFVPKFGEDLPVVLLILYQRNIERDLEGDDETSLALAIEDLLEQCVSRIFAILEADPEDDW